MKLIASTEGGGCLEPRVQVWIHLEADGCTWTLDMCAYVPTIMSTINEACMLSDSFASMKDLGRMFRTAV